ncbi:hypothetical protein JX265_007868 [Neoarthrinium moseri]|uniref:Uncharacterized protein n=1 Tax=Neoarthrinium moseri TaxID=1658444 RepID=A0A9P9WJL3_9PEZI|nr:hypothetical protein JX265_007868 [Neoarthrinium moseri]
MFRAGTIALALAALAHGAPISDDNKVVEERQWQIGDPWTTIIWGNQPPPTALPTSGPGLLPPITGGFNPPPKEKRQDDIGPVLGGSDPSALKAHIIDLELEYERLRQQYGTHAPPSVVRRQKEIENELKKYGITIVATPDGTSTTITFGKAKRQENIGPFLGGSDPSALKEHLVALELEYEFLVHQYGKHAPPSVSRRKEEIEHELKKYGITIVASPDGTSTTITPGKARRQESFIGDGSYGNAAFNLEGLERTLEALMQQYGPNPPHDVYIIEENIKHILLAYGIKIIQSPDGTSTTIYPSTKRSAPDYDIEKLEIVLESLIQKYNGERPPLADWLVIQHIAAVLKSYGITVQQSPEGTVTIIKPSDKRQSTISLGDSVNTVALQALFAMLEATYGSNPPRDIYLIEQTIATILSIKGIIIPGFTIPGGPLTPEKPIPGGGMIPDPTVPGGSITPDPTVPGGSLNPSTKRDGPGLSVEGLQAALAQLEAQYGGYGSGKIPVSVFIIMQNIVTILQAEGVTVPGWPTLGGGSTIIGPST